MSKQPMSEEPEDEQEGRSIADLVAEAKDRVVNLSRSKKPADRLRALNIIVFDVLAAFLVTHLFIYPDPIIFKPQYVTAIVE